MLMRDRNATAAQAGSIAGRVRALAVACIVPAWGLAVVVLYQAHEREREALVQSTVLSARALAKGIDREIATSLSVLQTLAQSPLIDDGAYTRLHAAAQPVLRHSGADNIVLFDTELRGLVSLAHPPDAVLPAMSVDRFPEVMRTLTPAVSDLFVGQVSRKPQVAVAVPVVRNGRAIARLEMVFSAERLAGVLAAQQVREGWTVGIFDRQGVLVARNREAGQFVGRTVAANLREAVARQPEGHVNGRTQDGIDVVACYSHAQGTGWTAVIGIPVSVLKAELLDSLLKQGAGALVLLGLGLALAQWLGRRLARPLQALVPAALAVGRGEPAPEMRTGLREADEVGAALSQASRLLHEREQARAEAERSLRDSEARLRHVLDVAQIGDWSLDVRTGQMTHSLRHDHCFGYAEPVADWSMERFLAHVHPDDRAFMTARVDEQMARGEPFVQESRVVWPDGSTHWIRGHGVPVVRDGVVTHVQGLVMDITDRRQAEELRLNGLRLEAENRQILEANRLKSEFLANMSHELRTPLNAVIGFADILLQMADTVPEARRRDYLQHIADSGRHLLRMINDVLDLSKVEAGRFEIHPEPLRLQPLVREVCGVLQADFARKRLRLQTHVDPAVDELVLDPARLKQMLYNYLSNAIKFTPEGGSVTLRARPEGAQAVRIEVEDTGIGIAPDDLPKLFTRFQQLQSGLTKTHAGTGLGLVLTLKLAQLHGGTAGVRSRLGEGSVFHIVLPRRVAPKAGAIAAGSPALHGVAAPDRPAEPDA